MTFPRYPEYKDSGVEWLGEVPRHWEVMPLKRLLIDPLMYGINEAADDDTPDNPRFVRITDIDQEGNLKEDTFRSLPMELAAPYILDTGDILLARSGATVGKSFIHKASWGVCCFAGYLIRARVNQKHVRPNYVYSCFQSSFYWNFINCVQIQSTIQNVSAERYAGFVLALPPIDEQTTIVTFLDRETAKVDALVAEQERLIELLKEKRQAVISHAVTKGLNSQAPMKDSGIEWLGEVPEHWEILPLKRDLMFLTSGSRGWAEHYADEGALFIRIGNLTRDGIGLDLSDIQRVSVPEGSEGERTRIMEGDVLFSITAFLGSVAVAPKGLETAYVSQHVALARLHKNRLTPSWVGYATLSILGKTYLQTQGYGGTKVQLSLDDIASLVLTTPPLPEQSAIVAHLDEQTAKIDALIAEAQRAIELLKEHRSALISAAVTGKIDVRGLVASKAETEAA